MSKDENYDNLTLQELRKEKDRLQHRVTSDKATVNDLANYHTVSHILNSFLYTLDDINNPPTR